MIPTRSHQLKPEFNSLQVNEVEDPQENELYELMDTLVVILNEYPQGLSEHDLLKRLQNPPYSLFAEEAFRDPLILFQTHFLLFHCLYRLREQYIIQGIGDIEISALLIKKQTRQNTPLDSKNGKELNLLSQHDPLAQYYLDWSHFNNTDKDDVESLLNSFWQKMWTPSTCSSSSLREALTLMELDKPIPLAELKVQYRRLANRHHPDKGGDGEKFKKICHAFQQLKHASLT
jgi:hypothetical protein